LEITKKKVVHLGRTFRALPRGWSDSGMGLEGAAKDKPKGNEMKYEAHQEKPYSAWIMM